MIHPHLVVIVDHGNEEGRLRAARVVDAVAIRDEAVRLDEAGKVLKHSFEKVCLHHSRNNFCQK